MEKMLEVVSIKQKTVKRNSKYALHQIKNPGDGAEVIHHYIGDEANEVFMALMLNTKNQVVAVHKISSGSLNATVVHPREVFKGAILNNSASIIIGHNHPSGVSFPSDEDIEVTKRLVEAGLIIGIEVLDHIITTENGSYTSLKERGYM